MRMLQLGTLDGHLTSKLLFAYYCTSSTTEVGELPALVWVHGLGVPALGHASGNPDPHGKA